ncbi:hypothetical protein L1275_003197 [Flavobacterium sp. HSC-61S13]|nr:hypothetical protein [Flavobacterium sp. HSC-61S13]
MGLAQLQFKAKIRGFGFLFRKKQITLTFLLNLFN